MGVVIKKWIQLGVFFCFAVMGCTHTRQTEQPLPKEVLETRVVPPFNSVNVRGDISLDLSSAPQNNVRIRGDLRDVAHVRVLVEQGHLFIKADRGYPKYKPITAHVQAAVLHALTFEGTGNLLAQDLNTPILTLKTHTSGAVFVRGNIGLEHLEVKGRGNVRIEGINSRNLDILMQGKPKITLVGMARLKRLRFGGSGILSMYWIDTPELWIFGKGQGSVELAGVAAFLHVNLKEKAHFYGQYLRTQKAVIHTQNNAVAEVQVLRSQTTLAEQNSMIYFYNKPQFQADFMGHNGAVLDNTQWR